MSLDISPTFRSGDYFAPMAKPKKLITRRTQREHWGFHAKSYGGIGLLRFDSKFKVGRKGLLVSRGHDHTGGGIHKFHPVKQPHQVTSLRKSACRPDDQLVPDVNKVDVVSIAKDANLLTKKPSDHDCFQPIFEVFPHFGTTPHKANMEAMTSKQKILGAKNIAALEDLTKRYYDTTSNRLNYSIQTESTPESRKQIIPRKEKPKKTVRIKSPHPLPGQEDKYNDVFTNPSGNNPKCVICQCQISVVDFRDGTSNFPICNYCQSTGIFRLDFYDNPYAYTDQCSRKSQPMHHTIAPLSLFELRRLTDSKVECKDGPSNVPVTKKEATLVKLIKAPVEKNYQYTSPLNYLGYYCGRNRNRLPSLIRKLPNSATFQDIDDVATPHEALTPKQIGFTRVAIPVSLKDKEYLKEKGICCSEHFLSKDENKEEANISKIMPDVHFPLSCGKNKDGVNEDDWKVHEGSIKKLKAPEKIKMFQTLAHRRYHDEFPELIPDLRESQKNSKKYFFHGYHTSVFRG